MDLRNKTLKEKVAYFVEQERKTREYPESFLGYEYDTVLRAFLKDYEETREFIKAADAEDVDCFLCVLCDFIKKYPNEEIIRLCIERKAQVGEGYTFDFAREIEWAKRELKEIKINAFRKSKKVANAEDKKFILSDEAVYFIKNFAMKELNIRLPIDEKKFNTILNFAGDCECHMINNDGYDIQKDYSEKERDILGDKFVSEVSEQYGDNCEPDLDDLNRRLQ